MEKKLSLISKIKSVIIAFFKWSRSGFKVSNNTDLRMYICKHCVWFDNYRCRFCGCQLKLKTRMKTERCPLHKW